MGGCLSCCIKHEVTALSEERHKAFLYQARPEITPRPSVSGDYLTTSARDMENSANQSQGSLSPMSVPVLETHGVVCANSTHEFVNHGLSLWNQTRQRWVGNKKSASQGQERINQEPTLSWNATYESLLGTNKPFPQPIPLTEMVDFLVDIWEQEGMYD